MRAVNMIYTVLFALLTLNAIVVKHAETVSVCDTLRQFDGNETVYVMTDVKTDVPVTDSDFQYTPPKNADVSTL